MDRFTEEELDNLATTIRRQLTPTDVTPLVVKELDGKIESDGKEDDERLRLQRQSE